MLICFSIFSCFFLTDGFSGGPPVFISKHLHFYNTGESSSQMILKKESNMLSSCKLNLRSLIINQNSVAHKKFNNFFVNYYLLCFIAFFESFHWKLSKTRIKTKNKNSRKSYSTFCVRRNFDLWPNTSFSTKNSLQLDCSADGISKQ